MTDIREALNRILAGGDLTRGEMEEIFGRLMDGELSDPLKAALLVALRAKGESAEEIAGAASAMRSRVAPLEGREGRESMGRAREEAVDTCGTGGDGRHTFNISTAAALVAAAGGVTVAKHGNRSVSSRSGSADVLASLGVDVEMGPAGAGRALDEVGVCFLFAPLFHPAMKEVMPVRRELGVRTLFNVLGPLTNPAGARRQLMGVYEARLVPVLAEVLAQLGSHHALVVHGSDGLDEITTTGPTTVGEARLGDDGEARVEVYEVTPEEVGLPRASLDDLRGGEPEENAAAMRRVLAGSGGPLAHVTAFNAGAALYVGGAVESIREGVGRAMALLDDGTAAAKLEELKGFRA